MSSAGHCRRQSFWDATHVLWRRAPLWRWCAYAALLCTALVVVLCLPQSHRVSATPEPVGHYTAPPVSAPGKPSAGSALPPSSASAPLPGGPAVESVTSPKARRNLPPSGSPAAAVFFRSSPLGGAVTTDGLTVTYCCAGAMSTSRASRSYASGKYYFELRLGTAKGAAHPGTWTNAGIVQVGMDLSFSQASMPAQARAIGWGQQKSFKDGDLLGFAVDLEQGALYLHVNGQWMSGPPGRGPGLRLDTGREYVPFVTVAAPPSGAKSDSDSWTANFGRTSFVSPLPTGYAPYDPGAVEGATAQRWVAAGEGPLFTRTSQQAIVPVMPNPSLATPAQAGTSVGGNMVGRTFLSSAPFKGWQVPLPNGEWVVSASMMGGAGGSGADTMFLARIVEGQLAGAVVLMATDPERRLGTGYRQYDQCLRKNVVHIETVSNEEFGPQECWVINHQDARVWQQAMAHPLVRAAVGDLTIRQVKVPHTLLSVTFRLADKNEYLNAIYYFNPEESGIVTAPVASWRESDWFVGYIARYPEKVAYVQTLKVWAREWLPKLKASFIQRSG